MGHEDVQRSLSHIHHAFTTIFDDETRGTFFNDVLALDTELTYVYKNHTSYSTLPTQLQSILRHHQVQTTSARVLLQTSVSRFGASFSIHSLAPGDSMVIIGTTEKWSAARITDIFVAQSVHRKAPEVFIAVEIYAALSHKQAQHDKFLRYPLAGRLFLDRILETSIVRAEQILCHYAATPMKIDQIGADCLHVLPLLRVSSQLFELHSYLIDGDLCSSKVSAICSTQSFNVWSCHPCVGLSN